MGFGGLSRGGKRNWAMCRVGTGNREQKADHAETGPALLGGNGLDSAFAYTHKRECKILPVASLNKG